MTVPRHLLRCIVCAQLFGAHDPHRTRVCSDCRRRAADPRVDPADPWPFAAPAIPVQLPAPVADTAGGSHVRRRNAEDQRP